MTKNQKGFIAVLLTAGIVFAAWRFSKSGKKARITYLIKNGYTTGTPAVLSSFGDDYINAWYKAAKAGQQTFSFEGKDYLTAGGKAKQ